jgi:dsDNA-binding SOS-regulon protein
MAIVAMWQCDRDGTMFASKKDAEAYDKMLELAQSFTTFIEANAASISADDAESIGLLLAKHKDQVVLACKGKPDELALAVLEGEGTDDKAQKTEAVVTPIASKG